MGPGASTCLWVFDGSDWHEFGNCPAGHHCSDKPSVGGTAGDVSPGQCVATSVIPVVAPGGSAPVFIPIVAILVHCDHNGSAWEPKTIRQLVRQNSALPSDPELNSVGGYSGFAAEKAMIEGLTFPTVRSYTIGGSTFNGVVYLVKKAGATYVCELAN